MDPNLNIINKKDFFLGGGGGVGLGRSVGLWGDRWMDRRTSPNQFAPSTSSKLGASQCIYVQVMQVMSLTSSIYNHFIISTSSVALTFNLPTYEFFS